MAEGRAPAKPSENPDAFTSADLVFEVGDVKLLKTGLTQVTIYIPYEQKAEAVKLSDAYGLLLEGSVTKVAR